MLFLKKLSFSKMPKKCFYPTSFKKNPKIICKKKKKTVSKNVFTTLENAQKECFVLSFQKSENNVFKNVFTTLEFLSKKKFVHFFQKSKKKKSLQKKCFYPIGKMFLLRWNFFQKKKSFSLSKRTLNTFPKKKCLSKYPFSKKINK